MKKYILLTLIASALALSGSLFAHNEEGWGGNRFSGEVNHVNRMLAHVRGELQRYGADRHVRHEFRHISSEIDHLNWEFRTGQYAPYHMRYEIEHVHNELHHIEDELHVPVRYYYRWE